MKILITGGTGFVGRHIIDLLNQRNHKCVVTSRNADGAKRKLADRIVDAIGWNPLQEPLDLTSHPDIDAVINLMGDPIDKGRWTDKRKQTIRDSRVEGTAKLVDACMNLPDPPKVFISSSAVGYYGDPGEDEVNESGEVGKGYLAEVCQQWEQATMPLDSGPTRKVLIRIGIVLGRDGGALAKLVPLFRWCLGGPLGNGSQYVPWIHVKDLASLFVWAIENESVQGVFNGTAPNPVRNSKLTSTIAARVRRPAFLPAPRLAVRIALGEFADSLFFSQRIVPDAALGAGFQFEFSTIESALEDLI